MGGGNFLLISLLGKLFTAFFVEQRRKIYGRKFWRTWLARVVLLWVEVTSQDTLLLIVKALKHLEPQKNVVLMGGKNVKGRKHHIVTDSQGYLLYILVHRANMHDTIAGKEVLKATTEKYPSTDSISARQVKIC